MITWIIFWGLLGGIIFGLCIPSVKTAWREKKYIKAVLLALLTLVIFSIFSVVHLELRSRH